MKRKEQKQKPIKKLSKTEQFILRLNLLKIWFIKNLETMIWVFFIVCVGLTFSGIIQPSTPILGVIFGDISVEIKNLIEEIGGNHTVYTLLESILSLCIVIVICRLKLRRIALTDIKSTKVKILLLKAGLYFNEDGKLTKRVENVLNQDLDNDGKIGDKEKTKHHTIAEDLIRAGEEFVTIVTLDLSNVEKDSEDKVYKTVGLEETKDGVDELVVAATAKSKKILDPSTNIEEEINKMKKSSGNKLKKYFKNFFDDLKEAIALSTTDKEKAEKRKKAKAAEKQRRADEKLKKQQKKEQEKQQAVKAEQEKQLKAEAKTEKTKIKKIETEEKVKSDVKEVKTVSQTQSTTQQTTTHSLSAQARLNQMLKNRK